MKSFLQTEEWAKFQESVGHKVWRFNDSKIRANIIKHDLPFGKSYLYIPHGPEVKLDDIRGGIKNELANFIKYLKYLAKEEKAIFVKVEPLSDIVMELLYRKGFRRSRKQIQPSKTVIINLNLSEEELLSRMHHKTRYNINLSEKKGLVLEESNDIDTFWKLLKQTAKKDQFSTNSKEYYEKMLNFFREGQELITKLFLVKLQDKYIGGAMVMIYHNFAYYLHGAMDREYKNLMAPYFMHWNIIKFLKLTSLPAYQLTNYDLWGIDAKKWPGVTRFKLGWGGDLKEYPGSFDLVVSRFWYLVYSLARKIF
ncbi:MAG: hypothetical protein A3B86_00615 [Candidatus Yanofskybacteria bacterium RIFCSPHIGHO2_02_FULL_38_22b]|uniref:BioF2-like acetyltransferase domain-containing protein n=1 Tax=Candidatus Yanofskybacteria bacterium RIFCSPHIGHO2_02_FULL_38_22b TaxID=1802673 RepID=A0A1F8F369_9BACT|nr:MAG: hypothetical protein A2816_03650 [Candidatus Yanofskybacteria bacterium RIFCSPHIGHO2_01_FULL_39_44]OGN07582.1 MAG: hypothetical protein A3B86_00615 [Candidatus Yanofskybacteria bacterium RIFCSPHIGHO2_02_FULL_38_22b]OGN20211.1 MAG: hypothetical protein A2910_00150 [Candidatus Yanofskybacteria bacterium RIFCSPLOWO2_01_FULL_39_28]